MSKRFSEILPTSLALCAILGLLTAAVFTFFRAKVYEVSTTLQVRPRSTSFEISPEHRSNGGLSTTFFPTEFEVVKATKTLDLVIDDLDLLKRWDSDRDTVRQKLDENIYVKNIRGTDLIEMRVHAASPEDAHAITEKLTTAYTRIQEQIIVIESQIETLLKYDGDQLITYAAGLQLPENIIRVLHPQYLEAKRNLDALNPP